jgi:hypothetical protein
LFDDDGARTGERERDRSVSRAVDALQDRFGRDVVVPGRMLGPSPGRRTRAPSDRKDDEA